MIFLGMAFFVYILLGFTEVPESVNVYPSLNLRYFQLLFPQRSFSPASLSLSFPSETQVTQKLDLLILPHWPLRLCISLWGFFPPFFSFFFRLDNFYGSVFKFTDSFLYCLHSTLKFLYYFKKCFWYCIFQFKEFNLYFLFLCWNSQSWHSF